MSQSREGFWDASSTTAFALQARSADELALIQLSWLENLKSRIMNVAEGVDDAVEGEDGAGNGGMQNTVHLERQASRYERESMSAAAAARVSEACGAADSTPRARSSSAGSPAVENDDPMSFPVTAILESMPRRLVSLGRDESRIDVRRVWTTLCCIATLETFNVCWIDGDGDLYPSEEVRCACLAAESRVCR